jgi:hypothetical protein
MNSVPKKKGQVFSLFFNKHAVFDFFRYRMFIFVKLHFHRDSVSASSANNPFFKKIANASIITNILSKPPGFIDEKVENLTAIAAFIYIITSADFC